MTIIITCPSALLIVEKINSHCLGACTLMTDNMKSAEDSKFSIIVCHKFEKFGHATCLCHIHSKTSCGGTNTEPT